MAIPLSANGNTYNYPETGDNVWGDDATNLVSSICAFLGNVGGGATLDPAAVIAVNSTTKGIRISRMTTVQRDAIASPGAGLIVYNTTTNTIDVFNGTAWVSVVFGPDILANSIRATTSAGLLLESNTGTDVALLGSGSGANSLFYGNATVNGQVLASDGTISAPGIGFSGDTNTGVFRSASDQLDIVTGGQSRFRVESTGQLRAVYESTVGTDYNTTLDLAYMCRAWVNFNGTGTVAIRASGNVSSITDNNVGDYTINFANSMPDVNYTTVLGGGGLGAGVASQGYANLCGTTSLYSTSQVQVMFWRTDAESLQDATKMMVAVFR